MFKKLIAVSFLSLILIGCGGGGSSTTTDEETVDTTTCNENEKLVDGQCIIKTCQADNYDCPTCTNSENLIYNDDESGSCEPVVTTNVQEELDALQIYADAKANSQERFDFAIEKEVSIVPTSSVNGKKSFYIHWVPDTVEQDSQPILIVSLHGSASYVFDSFDVWYPYLEERNYGILALQWWIDSQDIEDGGYYTPQELYPIISNILQELNYQPRSVIFHGFSRGSANSYAVTALDSANANYFAMIISNAGRANKNYPTNIEIENGAFGAMPFQDIPWVLYGGADDPNPDESGIPGMTETKTWIEALGADVKLFIADEDGGHGGFHMNPDNVNMALDVYEDITK